MRYYIYLINFVQDVLVGGSVLFLMTVPILISFFPERLPSGYSNAFFTASLISVTFVMAIRPLADLFPSFRWLRSLVILRKGLGILSASIIVSFLLSKIMLYGIGGYLSNVFTPTYWSLEGFALLAHLGDLTALPLLLTSNNFSKRILGKGWKRIQKLAYVYFYTGALYGVFAFGSVLGLACVALVTTLVVAASIKRRMTLARVTSLAHTAH